MQESIFPIQRSEEETHRHYPKHIVDTIEPQPQIFGYDTHTNFVPKKQHAKGHIDSYLYDYNFTGPAHECPYSTIDDIHDIEGIVNSVMIDG